MQYFIEKEKKNSQKTINKTCDENKRKQKKAHF